MILDDSQKERGERKKNAPPLCLQKKEDVCYFMRSKREEARVPWVRPRLLQAVLLLLLLLLLCVVVCSVFEAYSGRKD